MRGIVGRGIVTVYCAISVIISYANSSGNQLLIDAYRRRIVGSDSEGLGLLGKRDKRGRSTYHGKNKKYL
jgi:hypothetical protein